MKILLTSAYSEQSCLRRLRALAVMDVNGEHTLTTDANVADAILFVENTQFDDLRFRAVLDHPLVAAYPDKVFMYNEMDKAWPVLPGLYCSLGTNLVDPGNTIAFPYLAAKNKDIQDIYSSNVETRWLYSFVGSSSHPIRRQMLTLTGRSAKIVDTSAFCVWNPDQETAGTMQNIYSRTMAASKFVLCPRGIGPSSLRLYETIEAGRVPVIVSDDWDEPPQINWDFAVRVPESDIASIPDLLAGLEPQWQERAQAARDAWAKAYSPEQIFNTAATDLQKLLLSSTSMRSSLAVEVHKWKVLAANGMKQRARNMIEVGKKPIGDVVFPAKEQEVPTTRMQSHNVR